MKFHPRWLALLGLVAAVVAAAVVIGRRETPQQPATLAVVTGQVADTLHAVDRAGKLATALSADDEVAIGREIAAQVPVCDEARTGDPAARFCRVDEDYLNGIVRRLVRDGGLRRPEIPYAVHLVVDPQVNAFALPGGQLFVTTGMMVFLENEAEAAAILGHEMAHVDLKHCIEKLQAGRKAEKLGGAPLGEVASLTRVFSIGYSATLESEADRQGILYAAKAGYHPQGAARVMARMAGTRAGEVRRPGISDELAEMTVRTLDDFFRSHPGDADRVARDEATVRQQGYDLSNTPWYVGRKNFQQRVPRRQQEFPDEFVKGKIFPPPGDKPAAATP
jgi:predicted Zn-dependent protease